MIINISKKDEQIIKKLLEVKENNISVAEFYIDYLNNHYNDITSLNNQTFYEALKEVMEVSEDDEEFEVLNQNSNISDIKCLNPNEFLNDKYYKTIGLINAKEKDCYLYPLHYEAYEGFTYDEIKISEPYFNEFTPIGYFTKPFKYLAVIKDDLIWMSIIPHEINTMKEPIKEAFGNVLVLGLGLGYYAFHIALKDDVDRITIIENDPLVIALFKKHIYPKFKNKEKIHIIEDDAFHHLDEHHDYDFIFSDIWHNVADGQSLYLKIKQYEKEYKNTKFSYWIETSIVAMIRRELLTIFEEEYFEGFKEKDYLKAKNENDKIINYLYFLTKECEINSANDLINLLKDESIKKLVSLKS